MSDNLNKKVLLIGAGQMAVDYFKVLEALKCDITVVGRGDESANFFKEKTGKEIIKGGIDAFLKNKSIDFDAAIVAVGMEQLYATTVSLINSGFKNILVEKPAGLNKEEIQSLAKITDENNASVFVAYNRRFYASVIKAREIIEKDGGVTSFNFEFTEWAHTIEPLKKAEGVKENWLLANSSHVIDLAFYLGGKPKEMTSYTSGKLSWHDKAIYAGAGKTENGALFSYQANWDAPGRWGVEILTSKSRLILRPLEELQIQLKGSVAINKVEIDNVLDVKFKPGLYKQTEAFLNQKNEKFISIEKHFTMTKFYIAIANN